MIVLGIDTSDYANAIGVVDGENVLAEIKYSAITSSIEKITIHIAEVLQRAHVELDGIQGIGVGLGPGSWTGIRIGVTVAKMLAFSTNKSVAGVPTLEALAYDARDRSRPVIAVIDVGAGDTVYAAKYRLEADRIKQIGEYYVGDIGGISFLVTQPSVIIGAQAQKYARIVTEKTGRETDAISARPGGAAVATLAARKLSSGESNNVLSLTPLYLKESTAKAFIDKYRGNKKKGTL